MASFRSSPETFFVEEMPAYLPSGEGDHTYLWIEKKDLTTLDAVNRLARVLGLGARDIGYAGMKDRHATTRQWLSLPGVDPERARTVAIDGLRVLEVSRHRNKLRVGHLDGNRFEVVLGELAPGEPARIATTLRDFAVRGVPNRYGHQRFGGKGDNVEIGLAILRGTRREPDSRRRKLLLSAVQSAVFNRVLELRAEEGGLLAVRSGDILERWRQADSSPVRIPSWIRRASTQARLCPPRLCRATACARPNQARRRGRWKIALWRMWASAKRNSPKLDAPCQARGGRWWSRSHSTNPPSATTRRGCACGFRCPPGATPPWC